MSKIRSGCTPLTRIMDYSLCISTIVEIGAKVIIAVKSTNKKIQRFKTFRTGRDSR